MTNEKRRPRRPWSFSSNHIFSLLTPSDHTFLSSLINMSIISKRILVTGATGKQGGGVVKVRSSLSSMHELDPFLPPPRSDLPPLPSTSHRPSSKPTLLFQLPLPTCTPSSPSLELLPPQKLRLLRSFEEWNS